LTIFSIINTRDGGMLIKISMKIIKSLFMAKFWLIAKDFFIILYGNIRFSNSMVFFLKKKCTILKEKAKFIFSHATSITKYLGLAQISFLR